MPRPKKNVTYDANSETVRKFLERALKLSGERKALSKLISELNKQMVDANVHPGVISFCRRIAELPDGKRGMIITLTRVYLDWLEDLIDDPQLNILDALRKAKQRDASGKDAEAPPEKVMSLSTRRNGSSKDAPPPAA
jgi:hypothetical protein